MATGPVNLTICRECGASNYATSATCWMCHGKQLVASQLPPPSSPFAEPILAEVVYPAPAAPARQGSSILAVTLSTLAVGLTTAILGGIGFGSLVFNNGGRGDPFNQDAWTWLFFGYVLLGGLLATLASLTVTPPKTGWNPAASFTARFALSSVMLAVLFPLFAGVLVISIVIAFFLTCLSGLGPK